MGDADIRAKDPARVISPLAMTEFWAACHIRSVQRTLELKSRDALIAFIG